MTIITLLQAMDVVQPAKLKIIGFVKKKQNLASQYVETDLHFELKVKHVMITTRLMGMDAQTFVSKNQVTHVQKLLLMILLFVYQFAEME